jgi:hypothetical protein
MTTRSPLDQVAFCRGKAPDPFLSDAAKQGLGRRVADQRFASVPGV